MIIFRAALLSGTPVGRAGEIEAMSFDVTPPQGGFIGGRYEPMAGEVFEVRSPSDPDLAFEVRSASEEDIDRAVSRRPLRRGMRSS